MKTLIILILAAVCTSCTTYTITRTPEETSVKVRSMRSFEQPVVNYWRDGEKTGFTFGAESATQLDIADLMINVKAYCIANPVMCVR